MTPSIHDWPGNHEIYNPFNTALTPSYLTIESANTDSLDNEGKVDTYPNQPSFRISAPRSRPTTLKSSLICCSEHIATNHFVVSKLDSILWGFWKPEAEEESHDSPQSFGCCIMAYTKATNPINPTYYSMYLRYILLRSMTDKIKQMADDLHDTNLASSYSQGQAKFNLGKHSASQVWSSHLLLLLSYGVLPTN